MEAGMEKFLQSKGLGVEERDSLKADLKSAFESNVQSGSNPPDFETMQSTVKAVFEKHGLNADDAIATRPKPQGPPPGHSGPPPGHSGPPPAAAKYASADSSTTLLDLLQQASNDTSNGQKSSLDDFTESILTQLTKVSVRA